MKEDDRILASGAAKFLDDLGHHMEAVAIRELLERTADTPPEIGDAVFWEQKFNDLAFKYPKLRNKMKEPRFIKFKQLGSVLYVRFDQIQGVMETKIYTLDGVPPYIDIKDAIATFEKALKEEEEA